MGTANDWLAVAGGGYHSLGLRKGDGLWSWGWDNRGQLGLGDYTSRSRPTRVGTTHDWLAVAAGHAHSLALNKDGSLWAWGYDRHGQLGLGDTAERHVPTRVTGGRP